MTITLFSGIAHVGSSVLIGLFGIFLGAKLHILEKIEAVRGDLVGWALLLFGVCYMIWGIKTAIHHKHRHLHEGPKKESLAAWIIFLIFAFGPCEPLIPVLMFPAAVYSVGTAILIALVFMIATLATMMTVVFISMKGLSWIPAKMHRFGHLLAGTLIFACGLAIKLGL
jgi:nickel/cobalt transporter (NicO) family protein